MVMTCECREKHGLALPFCLLCGGTGFQHAGEGDRANGLRVELEEGFLPRTRRRRRRLPAAAA